MDWRVLLTTFGVIFLAEMGDKTQIAAMTMAAEKKRPWEVFIAASLALIAVSAIGVVVGGVLSQYLPTRVDQACCRRELHHHWGVGIVGKVLTQEKQVL